jgi:hypothetical protein
MPPAAGRVADRLAIRSVSSHRAERMQDVPRAARLRRRPAPPVVDDLCPVRRPHRLAQPAARRHGRGRRTAAGSCDAGKHHSRRYEKTGNHAGKILPTTNCALMSALLLRYQRARRREGEVSHSDSDRGRGRRAQGSRRRHPSHPASEGLVPAQGSFRNTGPGERLLRIGSSPRSLLSLSLRGRVRLARVSPRG